MAEQPSRTKARIAFEIMSDAERIGPAVDQLLEPLTLAAGAGLDADRLDDVRLCVTEALNNCVEHAYQGRPGNAIWLELRDEQDCIVVALADRGSAPPEHLLDGPRPSFAVAPGFDQSLSGQNVASLPEGGWGWQLIRLLADDVRLSHDQGWNRLTLEWRRAG